MTWQKKVLGEIADLSLGKMLDGKKNKGTPRPYLANINVRWGEFDLQNLRQMRFENGEMERYGLKCGDIVMCEGGVPGRCAVWKEALPGMMIQKALHRIRARDCIDHKFLYYSFLYKQKTNAFASLFTGATIHHLPLQNLGKLEIEFPKLATQLRIVDVLSAYDDLIEVNHRRIAVLEEMARRLFDEWFVHLRFPGHEDFRSLKTKDGTLPEGWHLGKLGDLLSLSYGKALRADTRVPGAVPVIGSSGIVGWHNVQLIDGPAIVLGRKGNVGSVIWSDAGCFPIDTVFYVETAEPLRFIFQLLQWQKFLNSDSAVPGLNRTGALQTVVLIPPASLTHRYAQSVEAMLLQVNILSNSNKILSASRDLLLPRLISGELSITEAERELDAAA